MTIRTIIGRRNGRSFMEEPEIREAMAAGDTVFVKLRGVYFAPTIGADDQISFTALEERPAGAD